MFQQLTIEDVRDVLFAVTFPERTTLFIKTSECPSYLRGAMDCFF
jgi:hypothetical protein